MRHSMLNRFTNIAHDENIVMDENKFVCLHGPAKRESPWESLLTASHLNNT